MQPLILTWHGPIDLEAFVPLRVSTLQFNILPPGKPVVYLWTIGTNCREENDKSVYYVGSTKDFPKRMKEHCNDWVSGSSTLFDPKDAVRGEINIVFIPGYDQWTRNLEHVARENIRLVKIFWASVEDAPEKEVEGALKLKLWRKMKTRGYQLSIENRLYKIHHDQIENRFPDGCNVSGL
jgi:GIY-YIG catalytic domain